MDKDIQYPMSSIAFVVVFFVCPVFVAAHHDKARTKPDVPNPVR
jgi:hypothetical protein